MKFFIDSANLDDIRQAADLGIVTGVTTNPSSMSKVLDSRTAEAMRDHALRIHEILPSALISVQVTSVGAEGMIWEGDLIQQLGPSFVVKVPATVDGIHACGQLSKTGKVNVTLVFSLAQALMAAEAGAAIVSPFYARMADAYGRMDNVFCAPWLTAQGKFQEIRSCYDRSGYKTSILAASIREAKHVAQVADAGADICTMSLAVLQSLFQQEQTKIGLEKMLADWSMK